MSGDDASLKTHRVDYRPPSYTVEHIELEFDLDEQDTRVTARSLLRRTEHARAGEPLVLDGEHMELVSIALDGEPLPPERYQLDESSLTLMDVPDRFHLEVVGRIAPSDNQALEGLYVSDGVLCTQCEPEAFRRITWSLDRPDVMARYRVTLRADAERYPVLLSNGNRRAAGALPGGRHYATWEDPHPKPSYLFALVAGRLACRRDTFHTRSGREVSLEVYVDAADLDQTEQCLHALKKVMRWDEAAYGRECDVDHYMIVGVRDQNLGGMENKGLNIFDKAHLLAHPETTTDQDYLQVESTVAHEYLHNWSGNRVTCRDWFQLSLKEGLTIFRDQEFSAAHGSAALQRIQTVKFLRSSQFPEDESPSAHAVRPESYQEISNFYTATIYYKGAELVRMMHELVTPQTFRRGVDLYFDRHDGQAVTCEELIRAMEETSRRDLDQFRRWYTQAGTPTLSVRGRHDPESATYTLECEQQVPTVPSGPAPEPLLIPIRAALIDPQGADMPVRLEGSQEAATEHVLELRELKQSFVFHGAVAPPVPSLLRNFSAPVRLVHEASDDELRHLAAHDSDPFNRWAASQSLMRDRVMRALLDLRRGREPGPIDAPLVEAFSKTLQGSAEPALVAEMLALPGELALSDGMDEVDPQLLWRAREHVRAALGEALRDGWRAHYEALADVPSGDRSAQAVGSRSLRNLSLDYLTAAEQEPGTLAWAQLCASNNMTDELAALRLLSEVEGPLRERGLAHFRERHEGRALVVDKWFAVQASARLPGAPTRVRQLARRDDFELRNPNRVRSLFNTFSYYNPVGLHAPDGTGYELIGEYVLRTDRLNPQLAAVMVVPLGRYTRYAAPLRAQMIRVLSALAGENDLSPDLREQVETALRGTDAA